MIKELFTRNKVLVSVDYLKSLKDLYMLCESLINYTEYTQTEIEKLIGDISLKTYHCDVCLNTKSFDRKMRVSKEYIECLESLYKVCQPLLVLEFHITEENYQNKISDITEQAYICSNQIENLKEDGKYKLPIRYLNFKSFFWI